MSETPVPAPEVENNHERLLPYKPLVGLQARMLLGGENINSKNRALPDITAEQIGNSKAIRERTTYQYLSNASTNERKEWWKKQGVASLNERLKIWVEKTTSNFQQGKKFLNQSGWKTALGKIGIDSDNFSQQSALNLYNEYFTGDNKQSQTTAFIDKVINAYTQRGADGQVTDIDYQSLKKDLAAFQWIGGMFGGLGKEVVAQLIDAEVRSRIEEEKTALIKEANEKETVNTKEVARLNRINDKEVILADYLYKGKGAADGGNDDGGNDDGDNGEDDNPQEKDPIEEAEKEDPFRRTKPTTEDPKRFKIKQLKIDSKNQEGTIIREFPDSGEVERLTDPKRIAEVLKEKNPLKYPNTIDNIVREIETEKESFKSWLKRINISSEKYSSIIQRNINLYGEFLRKTYNLNLPNINKLTIVPLHGKVSEVWNPGHRALGFFMSRYPVLFIDFDVIKSSAPYFKGDSKELTPQQEGNIVEKLLSEVQPHEYTHALSDIANWHLIKDEGTPQEKTTDIWAAKLGLYLAKPFPPKVSDWETLIAVERGRYLNEAVTQKLTGQWVMERTGNPPKNAAYSREIKVLDLLVSQIAKERDLPQEKIFQKFVEAHFVHGGFKHLADFLSGKKVTQQGIEYDHNRKHFLQIIYALMEYEKRQGNPNYPITQHYILGDILPDQAIKLESFLAGYQRKGNLIQLTDEAIEEMRNVMKVKTEKKLAA